MEIEVVLEPGQSNVEGLEIARQLMEQLDVRDEDILAGAYIDMQERLVRESSSSTEETNSTSTEKIGTANFMSGNNLEP